MNLREAIHGCLSEEELSPQELKDWINEMSESGHAFFRHFLFYLGDMKPNHDDLPKMMLQFYLDYAEGKAPLQKVVKFSMEELDRAYANEKKRDDILFD